MLYRSILVLASVTIGALAGPTQDVLSFSKPRPLVIWHGLGDSYASDGLVQFQSYIAQMHPGIFIHSIYIDQDVKEDQRATYYGNVDDQVEQVAEQLKAVPELSGGFDAMGFSQGGQFLRAYVERHNDPPIRNLITFGSQHMGIAGIPGCGPFDVLCQLARKATRVGVYNGWVQQNIIQVLLPLLFLLCTPSFYPSAQAQYYRDPVQLQTYLAANHFLTSINNELPATRNATYAARLATLDALVLVLFERDSTVIPKESAWFGSYTPPSDSREGDEESLVSMREQPLYTEDWIGLRALDERGRVVFASCDSEHMHLTAECWQPLVEKYVGSRKSS
ncbi:Alpha/Beta hydrolase protein [Lactarius akahatsu]|uniref:Palmitoyl-protein thioesterase 1 n=1 Tax=Lactarius akahatsu TaxID=416441 RepID=A0AAD4LNA8_9AGAM|nr:Alpha/Beta hydrolase protein [Lactarius akahatsu]